MPDARKRPCCICRRWFRPHPRVGSRQRACGNPDCQSVRRRKKQKQWRERNPDYFRARRILDRSKEDRTPEPLRLPPPLHRRNIDGRPFDFVKSGQSFMHPQNPTAKERSSTVLRFASSACSILKRSGGASRVEMNAPRAPLTPLPTSLRDPAEFGLHRFPQVLEIMPPRKNRAASSVSRNFLASKERSAPS